MHQLFSASLILFLAAPVFGKTAGQLCRGTAAKANDGNWYCTEVSAITYRNISQAGNYNITTKVDPDRGLCSHEAVSYSGRGSMTPLFGQLSMHLRGPMNVSQIAVYRLGNTASTQDEKRPIARDEMVLGGPDMAVEQDKKIPDQHIVHGLEGDSRDQSTNFLARRTFPSQLPPPPVNNKGPPRPPAIPCTTACAGTVTKTVVVTATNCAPCHPNDAQAPTPRLCPCTTTEATAIVLPSVDATDAMNAPYQLPAVPTKFITLPALPQISLPPIPKIPIPVIPQPAIPNIVIPPIQLPNLLPIEIPKIPAIELPNLPPIELPVVPQISLPPLPQITVPAVAVPTVVLPSIALPAIPPVSIAIPVPQISLPAVPKLPLPHLPQISLSVGAGISLKRREEATSMVDSEEPRATAQLSSRTSEAIAAAADWKRVAYYTSIAPAQATGFAFLANLGDDRKSGTFDYSFGNSLGFVTKDGRKIASEATPFDGVLETSEAEIAAFTDKPCDEGCEYWRPKSTANYGWVGEDKAFFIQFQMDHYDNIGNDQGMLSDAPAWWFLNAAIPRILQYGNDRNNIPCSCWSTGCGEFDAFEVLGRGEERAKSTIHRQGNIEGGDSNYFRRPVGRMLKFAVVFHNFNITAAVLPDDFDFSPTLNEQIIADIIAYDPDSSRHSLFAIGD